MWCRKYRENRGFIGEYRGFLTDVVQFWKPVISKYLPQIQLHNQTVIPKFPERYVRKIPQRIFWNMKKKKLHRFFKILARPPPIVQKWAGGGSFFFWKSTYQFYFSSFDFFVNCIRSEYWLPRKWTDIWPKKLKNTIFRSIFRFFHETAN